MLLRNIDLSEKVATVVSLSSDEKIFLILEWNSFQHLLTTSVQPLTSVSPIPPPSQLENRGVEYLLGYLWWRLPGAHCAVHLPRCLRASRGRGCHLCRLLWGTSYSADLQHAQVCRVSNDQMECGEWSVTTERWRGVKWNETHQLPKSLLNLLQHTF